MSDFKIKVDKYEFIQRGGGGIEIICHGARWSNVIYGVMDLEAVKALKAMMEELDAARGVLSAARRTLVIRHKGSAPIGGLRDAVELHDRLVGDPEPPSSSADSSRSSQAPNGVPTHDAPATASRGEP